MLSTNFRFLDHRSYHWILSRRWNCCHNNFNRSYDFCLWKMWSRRALCCLAKSSYNNSFIFCPIIAPCVKFPNAYLDTVEQKYQNIYGDASGLLFSDICMLLNCVTKSSVIFPKYGDQRRPFILIFKSCVYS